MAERKMLTGHTPEILQRKLEDFVARLAKRFGDMKGKIEISAILGLLHHLTEQCTHHVVLNEPVAVLGVGAVVPSRIVHAQAHEPAIEQVVAELLAQQPFAAYPVQRLQDQPHAAAIPAAPSSAPARRRSTRTTGPCRAAPG